ncbi:glycosyltransferase family 2 protein [Hyphococcus sp. DH-69]|uniref:glycosyltransferase family 2 protein n=1 Tax=Hyphococcus formosus TaxID=3143534 RepID=UPI00398BB0E6
MASSLQNPTVSVVMPAFNAEQYFYSAAASILNQEFTDFEFIIIDDHSTDQTETILRELAETDDRIKIYRNPKNIGVAASLNFGITTARGQYIARMDADDISLPQRFSKQVAFLDENPDFVFVGTGYQIIDAKGRVTRADVEATESWECEWMSLFRMPIIHPSMMIRRSTLADIQKPYQSQYDGAEDYDLVQRLLAQGKGKAIDDICFQYRMHEQSVSTTQASRQRDIARNLCARALINQDFTLSEAEIALIANCLYNGPDRQAHDLVIVLDALRKIEGEFAQRYHLNAREENRIRALSSRWLLRAVANDKELKPYLQVALSYPAETISQIINYGLRRSSLLGHQKNRSAA